MTRERYYQIREIAARNIERMRRAANEAREHTLLDGMVGPATEAT